MCEDRKGKVIVKILKVLCCSILVIVIALSAVLFCAVKGSRYLSPIIERIANDHIDGHLSLGSLKLGFNPGFPILSVEVENLNLVSHAFDSLTSEERGLLPCYSDSLLTLDFLSGSLDIKRFIVNNELSLHDVVLRGLSVNLVIAHNGKANYQIIKVPSDTVKSQNSKIPGFRINRFNLEKPKEIRFYNAADSTSASVLLLTDAAVNGDNMPTYRLKINGNVTSPRATLITNLDNINFGLNGKVFWNPEHPGLVAMEEMELQGAFMKAIVTGEIDLENNPIVRKAIVDLPPVYLSELLTFIPDSVRRIHRLYEPYFSTDLTIGGRFELTKPMDLSTDTLPSSKIKLSIPPSTLSYGKAQFKELAMDVSATTETNCPDSTKIDISHLIIAGPATRLEVTAFLSTLFSDPSFDTKMQGQIDLSNLPPNISEKIHGYLSGILSTDLHAFGRRSMLDQDHLHNLVADGYVTAQDIYYLSADTNNMVEVNKARIDFSSIINSGYSPLLSAKLNVDTATILTGGVDISLGSVSLETGVETRGNKTSDLLLEPIGGNLKVNRFNIISITDSAGARIRNLYGHILLQRYKNHSRIPEILADLRTDHISAGSLSDRILLDNTKINANLHKLPAHHPKQTVARRSKSLRKDYPYISPDSVFKLVYAKRHHKPGEKRKRRVYGTLSADNNEILEWDLANGFNRFLIQWELRGSLSTNHARLLTPIFPLNNRFSLLDLRFNNDTVNISNISLLTGRSDITISGLVTNVRRALTSETHDTLKVNLSFLSDTVDINELSAGAFTGASYADRRRHGKINILATDNDEDLEARINSLSKEGPGSSSPLLIPVNIDANLKIAANNVLYGDLAIQNMGGDILVYDGGVNLHKINATSDAGKLSISALYSAPKPENMHFGFGMELKDFNIGKFVKLVPAIDSIIPLMHDFSGTIGADLAATCRIDSGMNIMLPTLNAAIRINGDNLAFINPRTYRTLGKWLGFKNKADNTIRQMNVEMTVEDGIMRVYPFAFNIDRYRLGISGYNDIAMNFDYHISVLKSPIPFKFGITISGNPKKYKVRFGGAKFNENTAVESVNIVNDARINLIDQIENVFRRGVQHSRFAKLQIARPADFKELSDQGLSTADSLKLINEGLINAPIPEKVPVTQEKPKKRHKRFLFF